MSSENKKLFIVIPTYNEKENIFSLISEIAHNLEKAPVDLNVIVVDDNSPDGTADLLIRNMPLLDQKFPFLKVHLIRREGKLGLGTAYIRGFKEALSKNADYIMEMDADFSHQPKYLPLFIDAAQEADVVIGSRYVRGGGVENWSLFRRFISMGGSLYARTILGAKVQDLTGGFKLFHAKVLQSTNLDAVKSNGYSFQIEMTYRALRKGYEIKEIPIIFPDRVNGKSKMNKKIFLEALFMVWKLKFDSSLKPVKK